MLAHFKHPFAYWLDIPKVAKQGFAQARIEALSCYPIFHAIKPSGEIVGAFD